MADGNTAPRAKTAGEIGGGMSRREAKRLRMASMTREERGYLRRKAAASKVRTPVFVRKLFVSTMTPEYIQSASSICILILSAKSLMLRK